MSKAAARKRPGRRVGSSGQSRRAILDAARELFATRGFRGASTRAIAARAGVDIALLSHFFQSKAQLFAAVIELPTSAEQLHQLLANAKGKPGARMARYHLERVFTDGSEPIMAMLRAALGDPGCVPTLRALIERTLVTGAAGPLAGRSARLRAEVAGALMVGLFICRHMVRVEPLASASVNRVVALVAPALDEILVGDTGRRAIRRRRGSPR